MFYRTNFDCQCAHELAIKKKFILDDWSSRWYDNKTYNEMYPTNIVNVIIPLKECNKKGNERLVDLTEPLSVNIDNFDNSDTGYVDKLAGRVTYTELTTLATELCRTVTNEQIVACKHISN